MKIQKETLQDEVVMMRCASALTKAPAPLRYIL